MKQDIGLNDLLKAPSSFIREDYSSFLFAPFSRKINRRVYLYTPIAYALWVRLECDPNVSQFNERVPKVPIAIGTKAVNASPRAISVDKERTVTVHSFVDDLVDDTGSEGRTSPWSNWAQARGFSHIDWNSDLLGGTPTRLANLKRLLRYVSAAGVIPSPSLRQALLTELRAVRRFTLSKLVEQFPVSDPAEVQAEIARLILDRTIYSDIDRNPLSMITELSAHHALEAS